MPIKKRLNSDFFAEVEDNRDPLNWNRLAENIQAGQLGRVRSTFRRIANLLSDRQISFGDEVLPFLLSHEQIIPDLVDGRRPELMRLLSEELGYCMLLNQGLFTDFFLVIEGDVSRKIKTILLYALIDYAYEQESITSILLRSIAGHLIDDYLKDGSKFLDLIITFGDECRYVLNTCLQELIRQRNFPAYKRRVLWEVYSLVNISFNDEET